MTDRDASRSDTISRVAPLPDEERAPEPVRNASSDVDASQAGDTASAAVDALATDDDEADDELSFPICLKGAHLP